MADFDCVSLEEHQLKLLKQLVDAENRLPAGENGRFIYYRGVSGLEMISNHAGLQQNEEGFRILFASFEDLDSLTKNGFIQIIKIVTTGFWFEITSTGNDYSTDHEHVI